MQDELKEMQGIQRVESSEKFTGADHTSTGQRRAEKGEDPNRKDVRKENDGGRSRKENTGETKSGHGEMRKEKERKKGSGKKKTEKRKKEPKREQRRAEKSREFEDIISMKNEIEKAIEELDEGRFSDLSAYSSSEKLLIFQNELLNKIREAKEYRDTLQRVAADFDNYRKRMEKEKEAIVKFANEELLLKLLEVVDNFERALDNVKDREDDPFVEGVKMIYNQFQKIITDEGLKAIEETGVEFDPYIHEAMMQVVNNELKENTVTDVFQKGYILKDRVIRPAKVRISKKEA